VETPESGAITKIGSGSLGVAGSSGNVAAATAGNYPGHSNTVGAVALYVALEPPRLCVTGDNETLFAAPPCCIDPAVEKPVVKPIVDPLPNVNKFCTKIL